jgi:hypothetical protein
LLGASVDILSFALGFLAGSTFVFSICLCALYYFSRSSKKALEDVVSAMKKEVEAKKREQKTAGYTLGGQPVSEFTYKKMQQVQNITNLQNQIIQEGPARSDSVTRIQQLEEEKLDILTSILADGYDPIIATVDPATGGRTEHKLSEFLNIDPNYITKEPEAGEGVKIEKKGKFFVIQEDEQDFDDKPNDDDNNGGTTFH